MSLVCASDIRREVANLIKPPERLRVSQVASRFVNVRSASGGIDKWDKSLTPYMVEPMDCLTSRKFESVVFVGPAQSGKTQALITCFMAYVIKSDACDFMILQTSKDTARDFDMQVVKRALRDSPELKKELAPGKKSENTFDKVFRSGNILFQAWPSINKLSGKPLKYVLLTDYDRMPQDIDKEGSPYSLCQKRTAKFLSRGMTLVETSPGFEIKDPSWKAKFQHEAPPCDGALSLFNMGDMRRWYVKCTECGEYFMPPPDERGLDFVHSRDLFDATNTEITRQVSFICTASGCLIPASKKRELNKSGVWLPQGCRIEGGEVLGEGHKSNIASFWFPGILAAYSNPESLVRKYLNACREYDITGSEQNLKTTVNVDFGSAFLSRRLVSSVHADDYQKRAEDIPKRIVYQGVRFLIASIDVQARGFVVQVTGYGLNRERWVIDRFEIRISKRLDRGEPVPADPSAYLEDWDLITEKVLPLRYPLDDDSGRTMGLLITTCDSGGKKGVTPRAYEYWRKLRKLRLQGQFKLVKGERPKPDAKNATVRRTFPENTDKSKRKANARGEIPLWFINTTRLKDGLSSDLQRTTTGSGYIHFPDWLKPSFYSELTVEVRSEKGWDNPVNKPNESFDLFCYAEAGFLIKSFEFGIVQFNWDKPPKWALDWDRNIMIFSKEESERTGFNSFIKSSANQSKRRVLNKGIEL